MPAYSFSHMEFVSKILDGSKPHTIRPRRKNPTKPGDVLTLYYRQRSPECRAICLTVVTKVTPVVIYPFQHQLKLNGHLLGECKLAKLARRDGFVEFLDFFQFFERYGKPVLFMELIEWDTEKMLSLWEVDQFQELIRVMSAEERLAWLDTSLEIGEALEACDGNY